jgi:hypothetical protein
VPTALCQAASGWSSTYSATYCAGLYMLYKVTNPLGDYYLTSLNVSRCMEYCYSTYTAAVAGTLVKETESYYLCSCSGSTEYGYEYSYPSCSSAISFIKGASSR